MLAPLFVLAVVVGIILNELNNILAIMNLNLLEEAFLFHQRFSKVNAHGVGVKNGE